MVERDSRKIRRMFGAIAHRYDFLNHFLSLSIDRYWRWKAVRKLAPSVGPGSLILDLCTGTGDLALALAPRAPVVGCDFSHPMLLRGVRKTRRRSLEGRVRYVEGDALDLPFASGRFDAVTVAFGLRNLEDFRRGLEETHRVLRPRGALLILEFSRPWIPGFRQIYSFYFHHVLPRCGAWISGQEGPYSYLPQSVGEFPTPGGIRALLQEVGFESVELFSLTGGVVTLYLARNAGHPL